MTYLSTLLTTDLCFWANFNNNGRANWPRIIGNNNNFEIEMIDAIKSSSTPSNPINAWINNGVIKIPKMLESDALKIAPGTLPLPTLVIATEDEIVLGKTNR